MSLAFYRQSLQIQQLLAELFHNAMALRGIDAPDDVQNMPPQQRELAINSLGIAQQALTICVSSSSYREGLKYGMCNRLFLVSIYVDLEFSGSLYTCYCNICGIILIEAWSSVVSRFTMLMILYCDVFVSISPDHCDSESIRALVEKLTPHDQIVDTAFSSVFFMTFRLFTTPVEFAEEIITRFQLSHPSGLAEQDVEMWTQQKLKPVRLRVSNLLKLWLEVNWRPGFDEDVLPILRNFVSRTMAEVFAAQATRLEDLIASRLDSQQLLSPVSERHRHGGISMPINPSLLGVGVGGTSISNSDLENLECPLLKPISSQKPKHQIYSLYILFKKRLSSVFYASRRKKVNQYIQWNITRIITLTIKS